MPAFTVTSSETVTVVIEGADKATLLANAIDYALNNNAGITGQDHTDLVDLKTALQG